MIYLSYYRFTTKSGRMSNKRKLDKNIAYNTAYSLHSNTHGATNIISVKFLTQKPNESLNNHKKNKKARLLRTPFLNAFFLFFNLH